MTLYVGNNDAVTQKVKKAYIGVDGIGRNIKAMYVGDDNGIARKVFPDEHEHQRGGILFSSPDPFTLNSLIPNAAVTAIGPGWYGDQTAVEYSVDKGHTWENFLDTFSKDAVQQNNGNYEILLSGIGGTRTAGLGYPNTDTNIFTILRTSGDAEITVSGKLIDLIDSTLTGPENYPDKINVSRLFENSKIVDASQLELIESEGDVVYARMFDFCALLTNHPTLPKKVSDYGYWAMFMSCPLLTSVDNLTVSSVGVQGMYQMYYQSGVKSVTNFVITGNVGKQGCQSMFNSASALKSVSGITIEGDVGNYSFYYAFSKSGVKTVENIQLNGHMTADFSFSDCFAECTALTTVSNISFLHGVSDYGCSLMFSKCSSLISVTNINITGDITYGGCNKMFQICPNLTTITGVWEINNVGKSGMSLMCTESPLVSTFATLTISGEIGEDGCGEAFANTQIKTLATIKSTTIGLYGCRYMYLNCPITLYTYSGSGRVRWSVPDTSASVSYASSALTSMVNTTSIIANQNYYYVPA